MTDQVKLNYRLILKVFVFANLAASIGCLIYAFYQSVGINELGDWYFEPSHWPTLTEGFSFIKLINYRYSNFSHGFLSIFQHPSYFSVYILFSITILVYLIRSSQSKGNKGYYSLIVYFSVFVWLLGSRAAYVTYFLGLLTFIVIIIVKFKKYWIGIAAIILSLLVSGVILSNKQLNKNVREIINLSEGKPLNKDSDVRLRLWRLGYDVFKDNLWFGVGTGDTDEVLHNKFVENNLKSAEEHNYNMHNQYLDTALKLGTIGLLILLSWIFFALIISIRRKQFLFFFFMLIMAINFFFEVMLSTITGVSFFVFFYSLLYNIYNQTEKRLEI